MKTKAAVLYEVGAPLQVEELELAAPKAGEVLIKMVASGICHSDYSFRYGVLETALPVVLGHEGAGIVQEVGPGVTNVAVGDHVVCALTPSCGECGMCKENKPYLCADMGRVLWKGCLLDGTTRFSKGSQAIHTLCAIGSFSEYSVIPAGSAIKVTKQAPLETVCLVGCGVTTGVGAALNTATIQPGNSVAIIGCGGVGLSVLQGCRIAGAETIIAIDPVPEKRALARSLGATHVIDPGAEDPVKAVRKLTNGGVHFAFEALGRTATIEQAWNMARLTGEAIIVGVPSPKDKVKLGVLGFFAERRMKGSAYGSSIPKRDIPRFVDLYLRGELKLDEMITKRITLEDVNQAFDEMSRGEGARSVITYV